MVRSRCKHSMSCIIHIDTGVVALVVLASAYILLCFFAGGTARG